jgi:hypothetical protein
MGGFIIIITAKQPEMKLLLKYRMAGCLCTTANDGKESGRGLYYGYIAETA